MLEGIVSTVAIDTSILATRNMMDEQTRTRNKTDNMTRRLNKRHIGCSLKRGGTGVRAEGKSASTHPSS